MVLDQAVNQIVNLIQRNPWKGWAATDGHHHRFIERRPCHSGIGVRGRPPHPSGTVVAQTSERQLRHRPLSHEVSEGTHLKSGYLFLNEAVRDSAIIKSERVVIFMFKAKASTISTVPPICSTRSASSVAMMCSRAARSCAATSSRR